MPTDTERREVARRLRESAGNGEVLRDVFLEEILAGDTGLWFAEDIEIDTLLYHLADLIDPTRNCSEPTRNCKKCDRDALLALADEMDEVAQRRRSMGYEGFAIGDKYMARCIREALGVER